MLIAGAVCPHPPLLIPEALGSAASDPPDELRKVAAAAARAVAVLAMGDACARPAREAPEAPDPDAQDYDEEVAEALAAADARWLARLDPALDEELVVAGRAAWQVLAGAAGGRRMHGRLLCMSAPYGVTYLVASWDEPRPDLCHRPHRTPVTCRGKPWLRSGHAVREGTRHRERLRDPARPR